MNWRDRERRPGRREAFRDPRPKLLIVCEGKNTEPEYFVEFAKLHRNSLVKLEIAKERGVPLTLVHIAKDKKYEAITQAKRAGDDNVKYDSVWCVFDVDEHPHIPEAKAMAATHDINVAVSNPCIELWLLLHLRDCPGMQHRHVMQGMLKAHVPDYDKKVQFELYKDGYDEAVKRAKRLDALALSVGEPGRNPTTNVFELTETIKPPPQAQ
jgi:RloB-like protein